MQAEIYEGTPGDLNEEMFLEVCRRLQAPLTFDVLLMASDANAELAAALSDRHDVDMVIIPDCMLKSNCSWAVRWGDRIMVVEMPPV